MLLFPGGATAEGPGELVDHNDLGLIGKTWVRVASKLILVSLTAGAIAAIVIQYR